MTKNRSVGVHDCLFRTTFHRAAAKQVYDYEVKGRVVCELFAPNPSAIFGNFSLTPSSIVSQLQGAKTGSSRFMVWTSQGDQKQHRVVEHPPCHLAALGVVDGRVRLVIPLAMSRRAVLATIADIVSLLF